MSLLENSLRLWAQQREFRAVHRELARRSDRELRDMGLARGDLVRLAEREAERRIVTPAARQADVSPAAGWTPVPVPAG
jgi:uncharacterized protein YjiS (DUF1127 family)